MVLISLVIRHGFIANELNLKMLINALLESLMIIRGDSNVGVLWYMSAIFNLLYYFNNRSDYIDEYN